MSCSRLHVLNCRGNGLVPSRPTAVHPSMPRRCAAQAQLTDFGAAASDAAIDLQGYTPSPMDPSVQMAQAGVVILAFSLLGVWWGVVVPSARQKLATDKRRGPLREFLEQVDIDDSKKFQQWFFSKWLTQMPGRQKARARNLKAQGLEDRIVDGEEIRDVEPAREKSGVEKFISGDNPIIVVMGILGAFVAVQIALHPR